jgi:hypothetical protein
MREPVKLGRLLRREEKAMSHKILDVKTCSKHILIGSEGHGKSPCFSQVTFQSVVGPDYPSLVSPYVYGANFVECAFLDGNV